MPAALVAQAHGRRWALVRLILGFAQMAGAALTLAFLLTLGVVHRGTIAAAAATTALTALSQHLFRTR